MGSVARATPAGPRWRRPEVSPAAEGGAAAAGFRGGGGRGGICACGCMFFRVRCEREGEQERRGTRASGRGLKTLAPKTQGLIARRPRPRRSGARRGGRVPGFDLIPLRASKARAPPATGHFFPPPGIQAHFHLPSYGFQSKQENNIPRRTATRNSRAKVTTMMPTTFSRSAPMEKAEPAARASMASGHRSSPQRPRS